ncbi:uncharacterized protein LOC119311118 isoform X2 [Triticum dicoccoides]|uniref:uncharacterized protein LOC119311118 isoform X2 n=1 Tax=Triticum dicoccoides TaxID=85692 RepID=UPI001891C78A|nr:uncharacterized protein LOC119311118 isoform X2 [Triticum dicoccoides]
MGWEKNEKHLLSLSLQSLQSLCKEYNLPANKTHPQLARSLAIYLENEKNNSGPEKENLTVPTSTQASPATSAAMLPNTKEASKCEQDNHKRGPYSDRDDDDVRPPLKHKKVSRKQADRKLKSDSGTRTSLPPISSNNGKGDCFNSCSGQGISHNVKQTADGIATCSTAPKLNGNHVSVAPVNDTISFVASHPGPNGVASKPPSHMKAGTNGIDKGSGLSNENLANVKSPFKLFLMDEDGIDLFVDLNSTPGDWVGSFKGGVNLPPSTHNSETDMFTNSISSLRNKNDQNTMLPSDNIIIDIQDKGPESIAACTNSSLGSTDGENYRSKSNPRDTTAVNSRSSASTLSGTPVEISVSQEGPPVVHSSCLTSDVQNNVSLDMVAGALGSNVLPQESADVSMLPGRSHAPLTDDSIQPTNESTFSPGHVVISDTDKNSRPPSVGKQEMLDVTSGVQRTRNSDTNGLLMENVPTAAVAMEEDNGHGGSSSVRQLVNQAVIALPAANAQSDASSADRGVAGNFDLTDPTRSSVASDNAVTPLATNHGAKTGNSHDSADKEKPCDPEELQGVATRNILCRLRSAAAKQTKPSTVPRRSSRLVPK